MAINRMRVRELLERRAFDDLFIEELGWDNATMSAVVVRVGEATYTLSPVAQKRGFAVFACATLPDFVTRGKVEKELSRRFFENMVIFYDAESGEQRWLWTKREVGKPLSRRERGLMAGQTGEPIVQALEGLAFTLDEEADVTLVGVASRVRASFDMEKVTKRFYERFKREHDVFMAFIEGVPSGELASWYASIMLNRLMFLYFIQQKGFLDGKMRYLQERLAQSSGNFYRDFLLKLFFDGLAVAEKTPETRALLGDVPYLNGGIFLPHSIEQQHGAGIHIADEAFAKIFAFFDSYQWHLDERPLHKDNEINPDVLGYIFEKYINQKQMGAYYTKEDITEYISKNTVLPYVLERVEEAVKVAFTGEGSLWGYLAADPDRYIYAAVRHGCQLPLPEAIAAGLTDVRCRAGWNAPTPAEYGLPTEIWRETLARRQRYEELRGKLARGEVKSVNALVTQNLDIRQFAQDVIDGTESSDVVKAFWRVLTSVTVLDPTCGSGAFLFAALNVLEPLYAACLERMRGFVAEADATPSSLVGEKSESGGRSYPKHQEFRKVLEEVDQHANEKYFIYKRIILNNLYGVDIMDEAVEICKLRLFLKLVAQEDNPKKIEPLPDIDFNIRAGNALVGFATEAEIKNNLFAQAVLPRLEVLKGTLDTFRQQQLEANVKAAEVKALKQRAQEVQAEISAVLDKALAPLHGFGEDQVEAFRASHKPFHWYAAFYSVLARGGFDVIIGNPPYVEYSKVKKEYAIQGYKTESAGNLYAYVMERSFQLEDKNARSGMIVPHSVFCTDRMESVMQIFEGNRIFWASTYDIRPAKLFVGVDQRLAIYLTARADRNQKHATRYNRWNESTREHLFHQLCFEDITELTFKNAFPKVGYSVEPAIWKKLQTKKPMINSLTGSHPVYYHNAPYFWTRAMDFVPYFWNEREGHKVSGQVRTLKLASIENAKVVVASMNSTLFYWWFVILSDCRHLNLREIEFFPLGLDSMADETKQALGVLADKLMADLKKNASRKKAFYKTTGRVEYDEFYPKLSKPIIDDIDRVLARHYGFTDEELDFILNYDIKYRMGDELGEEDDDEA